jgi:uracil-DNA glycosylase
MTENYQRLLDSTIEHLKGLKASGREFVVINSQTLKELQSPAPLPRLVFPTAVEDSAARPSQPAAARPTLATTMEEPVVARALSAKEQAMEELRLRAAGCFKCPNLVKSRKNVVFGVGSVNAELMFVGEAPGADEDAQGEPFVGAAGQLLTKIIKAMGLSRETVYIANILKCRPDMPAGAPGNRKPTPDEMKTCSPYLLAQIDLIKPKVIVALGATSVEGLLGKTDGITKLRGNFKTFRDTPLMPTFHPAYLLRNQAVSEKRKVWEDMLAVMEKLNLPISDKQRGYFLSQ